MSAQEIKVGTLKMKKAGSHDEIKIAIEIEKMVADGLNYIEAVVEFCEKYNIEVEDAPKFIHKNIMEKLKLDAERLKHVESTKGKGKLPF